MKSQLGLYYRKTRFAWLSRPALVGKALIFTHELYLFIYQSTVLSIHVCAVDGHQMYSGGSIEGKASTIGIEISPSAHPSPDFHMGQKCVVFNITKFSEVGSTHPWEPMGRNAQPLKLHGENMPNHRLLSRGLFDFAQILYRLYIHSTRSAVKVQGQEVKGQGNIWVWVQLLG